MESWQAKFGTQTNELRLILMVLIKAHCVTDFLSTQPTHMHNDSHKASLDPTVCRIHGAWGWLWTFDLYDELCACWQCCYKASWVIALVISATLHAGSVVQPCLWGYWHKGTALHAMPNPHWTPYASEVKILTFPLILLFFSGLSWGYRQSKCLILGKITQFFFQFLFH